MQRQRFVSTARQRRMNTAVTFAAPAEPRPEITAMSAGESADSP